MTDHSALARRLAGHAWPMLVGQLASMGMMVADTVLAGRYGTEDLAAVAVGSGVHISVVFAFVGIVQAVAPIAAHQYGAREFARLPGTLQQGLWLALLLAVPGMALLLFPDPLLALSGMPPEVEAKTRLYLNTSAWAIPAALCYRTMYGFINALGRPRVLMAIQVAGACLHVPLTWALINGHLGTPPLGAQGCALSTVVVVWVALVNSSLYLAFSAGLRRFRLFADWQRPRRAALGEILRLGLPMGFSNFVEITSFTLIALLVATLGPTVVAGHRIVANIAAVCYMLPLSLGIATLVLVGQAAGARNWRLAQASARVGTVIAATVSTLLGIGLWAGARPLVALATKDDAVRDLALALVGYIAIYQFFDAVQTVAAQALRGYKVTFLPMFVHVLCFWGIGLAGGYLLAYHGLALPGWQAAPMGVAGFWLASVVATVLVAGLLGWLLHRVVSDRLSETRP